MIPEYITVEQVKAAIAALGVSDIPRPQRLDIDRGGIHVTWLPDGYQLRVQSSVFIPLAPADYDPPVSQDRRYDRSCVIAELSAETDQPHHVIEALLDTIDRLGIKPEDWRRS